MYNMECNIYTKKYMNTLNFHYILYNSIETNLEKKSADTNS